MKYFPILFFTLFTNALLAQEIWYDENDMIWRSESIENEKEDALDDFTYEKLATKQRKATPYAPIREADVVYSTRLERIMDTQEKQNAVCRWVKNPLAAIVFDAANRGEINAYKNDSLRSVFRANSIYDMFATKEIIRVPDWQYPGEFKDSIVFSEYNLDEVVRWKIVEDWVFDKQIGEFKPRIVAIAPIMNLKAEGQDLGEYEGFYISWDESRKLLVNERTFNRHNEAGSFTYYDFFEGRLFSSYITKEPNVFDLSFSQYGELEQNPLAQILESERVKNELMNRESDWWQD